jgi:hypothetical protein
MKHIRYLVFSCLLLGATGARSAGLPDTGQDTCYNNTVADGVSASSPTSIARDAGTHPRQDCRYGRDAAANAGALTKIGAGAKGFDYTKIANNGSTLAAGAILGTAAGDWACTLDNVTGLMWEVKTVTNTSLRYSGHTYTWYSTNGATNGGKAGSVGIDSCNNTLGVQCNTQAYVAAVNAAALCSHNDWRLPTRRELMTLVYANGSSPTIDATYFPNTQASSFWSSTTYAVSTEFAWQIVFFDGYVFPLGEKAASTFSFIRLVRGSQF